jgi:Ser/Thr protein kinase RdoA (MazF antagonist)
LDEVSATAKTHGLDGTLVEPDWPPLTVEEVRGVLRGFADFEGEVQLLSVSPRPFSAASVVLAGEKKVFVKRHARAVRDAEGLHEEHAFMAHLRARGASVPKVLADTNGETAIEIGEWTYEIHELPPGIDLYQDAISWTPFFYADHARAAGEMLARLHRAAEGFDAPARTGRQLVAGFGIFGGTQPLGALQAYLNARPRLARYTKRAGWLVEAMDLLLPFYQELLPLLPSLRPLWTHNDLHPSNLFWSSANADARVMAAIDFGLSDRTNAVHDIAHAIERSMVEWLVLAQRPDKPERVPIHFDHLTAMLDAYETVRPLSSEERTALAPMLALCHVEFALSEADYFLTALRSEEKARIACEGYLLGHSRWWHDTGSGAGAKLLDAIRAWAAGEPMLKGCAR